MTDIETTVLAPGLHTLLADDYHRDPCAAPSLSASVASILISASPAHAHAAHPKLNPDLVRTEKAHYDIGTAAHALLLESRPFEDVVEVIDAADWRTNTAKEAALEARDNGRIPLLTHVAEQTQLMVAAARTQLAAHHADPTPLTDGTPEQTIVWQDNGVWCRARIDWLRDDLTAIDDLKTTSRSASPYAYTRALFNVGGDIQAAFYLRGIRALTGKSPVFRWIVIETKPPFALSIVSPGPAVLELASSKVDFALNLWRRCLETGTWPAYPPEVAYADLPSWEESRWLDREALEEELAA